MLILQLKCLIKNSINNGDYTMPYGTGTYGTTKGRPPKKLVKKSVKKKKPKKK